MTDAEGTDTGRTDTERTDAERLGTKAAEVVAATLSESERDDLGAYLGEFDDVEGVAGEALEVVRTVDLVKLAAVIDWENLPAAVEPDNLPAAIAERDPTAAIAFRELVDVEDLSDLLRSVDARELWRATRELDDALDDVAALDDVQAAGDGAGGAVADEQGDVELDAPDLDGDGFDPQAVEKAVQARVSEAVGEFRESLLDAHDRFERVREENESRFQDNRRTDTRNPTAVSTMPARRSSHGAGVRHSTVPEETRHSTAPNRPRVYGPRFDDVEGDDAG